MKVSTDRDMIIGLMILIGLLVITATLALIVANNLRLLRAIRAKEAQGRTEMAAISDLNKDLRKEVNELTDSNVELERFAYIASHDLQEPLRGVLSYLQLLQREYQGQISSDALRYIHFALQGSERMKKLISDLLEYSLLSNHTASYQDVDLDEVLRDVLAVLRPQLLEQGAIVAAEPLPVVRNEKMRMVQLFQNLVGNAIKYRDKADPRIHIGVSDGGDNWVLSVRDNGIGIDPLFFDRIFVIFQRLHGWNEYPGTGIGLTSCKKIVERRGGRIWVDSAPGKGSTFFFTMPKE
jgi:light-regulated signal transduction histidine kinase (bacteriophytochrome)